MATKPISEPVTVAPATGGGLSFDFQGLPFSLNNMLRSHWRKRGDTKLYYAILFRTGYNASGVKIAQPVEIDVTWRVMQMMDLDNAYARFKVVGDAMRDAGIIADDNPEVVKALNVKQEIVKHRAEQGFTVTVREYLPFTDEDDEPELEPEPVRIQYVPTRTLKYEVVR